MTESGFIADIEIFSFDGRPHLKIEGFRTRKTDQNRLQQMLTKQGEGEMTSWFLSNLLAA